MPVYTGYATQRGYGLGNVLGKFVKRAIPVVGTLAKNAAKSAAVGAINSGLDMMNVQRGSRKRKGSNLTSIPAKRRKVVKRSTRIIRKHKRKTPPGKPVRSKKKTQRKKKSKDIFS